MKREIRSSITLNSEHCYSSHGHWNDWELDRDGSQISQILPVRTIFISLLTLNVKTATNYIYVVNLHTSWPILLDLFLSASGDIYDKQRVLCFWPFLEAGGFFDIYLSTQRPKGREHDDLTITVLSMQYIGHTRVSCGNRIRVFRMAGDHCTTDPSAQVGFFYSFPRLETHGADISNFYALETDKLGRYL